MTPAEPPPSLLVVVPWLFVPVRSPADLGSKSNSMENEVHVS